ncbi:MAG: DNA polymerase Y family protein, partial [Gammaproteobacteria bacterium]|nr:DNA polymerase Y family protein [Gammaproteobacteria bacterium]
GRHSALWIGLYFPVLPLEVFSRHQETSHVPDDQPLVIIDKGYVVYVDDIATSAGIRIGHSLDTARAIHHRVQIMERNRQRESRAIAQLAQWAFEFTPRVSIQMPFALLLEVSGSLRLFKGPDRLKTMLLQRLMPTGYTVCLSMAPTAPGALLLARAGKHGRLYENNNMPGSEVDDTKHAYLDRLSSVSLDHIEADTRIISALHRAGINRLGMLLDILQSPGGPHEIGERYGPPLVEYLWQILGKQPSPRRFVSPRPAFFSEINFMEDITGLTPLLFPARKLLFELCQFLSARHLHISRIDWQISHRRYGKHIISIPLAQPANNYDMFFMLTRLRLESDAHTATHPPRVIKEIDSLALMARRFSPAHQLSGDMFGPASTPMDGPRFSNEATQLLNQLNTRLGQGACFGLALNNDHRPELAWQAVGFQSHRPHGSIAGKLADTDNPRPLYLLKEPCGLNNKLVRQDFELLDGPERIDFGWWDLSLWHQALREKSRHRDYFIARYQGGCLCWLYQYQGGWYLHGFFS